MNKKLIFLGLFAFSMGLSAYASEWHVIAGALIADSVESKNTRGSIGGSNPYGRNS